MHLPLLLLRLGLSALPALGPRPGRYYDFVLAALGREKIDVLLPSHEQALIFSRKLPELGSKVAVALPAYESYLELFSKTRFMRLLARLGLSFPPTGIYRSEGEALSWDGFPCYLKTEYGTASAGVWRAESRSEYEAALAQPRVRETLASGGSILAQEAAPGRLEIAYAAFRHGELVALHCSRRLKEGARGSSSVKVGVDRPVVRSHFESLGENLAWHGPLAVDYLYEDATGIPRYIDASPRLVEPMNAYANGVDLVEAQVLISLGRDAPRSFGTKGVRTHMEMLALLRAAERGTRRAVLSEALAIAKREGEYRGSGEELSPAGIDPWSTLPLALVASRLLLSPRSAAKISGGAVGDYAMTESAIREIDAM